MSQQVAWLLHSRNLEFLQYILPVIWYGYAHRNESVQDHEATICSCSYEGLSRIARVRAPHVRMFVTSNCVGKA
jgi:hypothetical protein